MTRRIAIVDLANQDLGLKIIFPDSDYYSVIDQFDRSDYYQRYNFERSNDLSLINDRKYDTLFVIAPLLNTIKTHYYQPNPSYNAEFDTCFQKIIQVINNNLGFANVCIFDNYDYDYDPNIIFDHHTISRKNMIFFKRNYNKGRKYTTNVFPFPYIIFGHRCNIDMLQRPRDMIEYKLPRLFFAGSLFTHADPIYKVYRDRNAMIQKISAILPPGILFISNYAYEDYMNEMCKSKFCLDLLGCGDPNIRSFEIFSTRTLRISQRSNLKWNFDDDFCEETYFDNETDLLCKLLRLQQDDDLYNRCLTKQNEIVDKYMNVDYLNKYIQDTMSKHTEDTMSGPIVFISSVINITNTALTYTPTRSVFTHSERFGQTLTTIKTIRKCIPNARILLVECTDLTVANEEFLTLLVDHYINIHRVKNMDTTAMLRDIHSPSKTIGEATLTIFAINYLIQNQIPYESFIKISGRYWLTENMSYATFQDHKNAVSPAATERDKLCTSLYKLTRDSSQKWLEFLNKAVTNHHYMYQEGFEKVFGDFIATLDPSETTMLETIGVSGFIAVDHSYKEW